MKKVTAGNYLEDRWYPRVVRAVSEILAEGGVVMPVEVLVRLKLLRSEDLEDWRFRRIPYLEKVIQCNLSNANRVLRVLRLHALEKGLFPSPTVYTKWGKGRHRILLQFSKTGDPNLEAAYSTHYISRGLIAAKEQKKAAQSSAALSPDLSPSPISPIPPPGSAS